MSRLLGIAGLYAAMFLAWTGVGLLMIIAPGRIGNLVHESFGLCPVVRPDDWGKKLIIRLTGAGLIGFAVRFALRVAELIRSGG